MADSSELRFRIESLSDSSRNALIDEFLLFLGPFLEENTRRLSELAGAALWDSERNESKAWSKEKLFRVISRRWKHATIGLPLSWPSDETATDPDEPNADQAPDTEASEVVLRQDEMEHIRCAGLDARYFDKLLRLANEQKLIQVRPRRDEKLESQLSDRFMKEARAIVVGGQSEQHFFDLAADTFVKELARVGENVKRRNHKELNLGLVSGSTVAGAIDAAIAEDDWAARFGIDPRELPPIRIFALNVCLTEPDHLDHHSTILVHRLCRKIHEQRRKARQQSAVEEADDKAFGLSAPLLVVKSQLRRYDSLPQTKELIEVTDPGRLPNHNDSADGEEDLPTKLDLVLTSVGQRTQHAATDKASIFYQLSEYAKHFLGQPDLNIDQIAQRNDMQGDLVYTPIDRDGGEISIPIENDGKEDELLFYSAIRLKVLQGMANDARKSVIMIARHSQGKDKSKAILAAISRHRYASLLVVDEMTAKRLLP